MNPIRSILRAAGFVLAALALGVSVDGSATTDHSAGTPRTDAPATESIECGGYDEAGNVIEPRAVAVTEVPLDDHGRAQIPAFCGGFTADGTYIGDL